MHPLVEKLTRQFRLIGHTHPRLLELLELGARAEPRSKDRPERRRQQMRMLRQWERLEEAFRAFIREKATDEDLVLYTASGSLEPFFLENSGWLAPGLEPECLRGEIAKLLTEVADLKRSSNNTMKAPLLLEDQFHQVVTSSESAGGMLDKFLRGSLRSSTALARLLSEIGTGGGEAPSPDTIKECEAALLAQGFTH